MNREKSSVGSEPAFVFSPETRQHNIDRMDKETFDVLVIGGGITGAGIARDAAMRGLKTALIEKSDFGAGTSSRSSKLVHGGFRYLKQLQFRMVREALVERKILTDLAPHMVYPIECLLPIYRGSIAKASQVHIGMRLYDILASGRNIGRYRMVSAEELTKMEPQYRHEGLRKAAEYCDCWADDFRLVMATIQSAAQNGANIANYIKAIDIIKEKGTVAGVLAVDQFTGREIAVRSRVVANATGPWSDDVRGQLLEAKDQQLRLTKGVHLIVSTEVLPIQHALMQFAVKDGRPIFAIPWRNFVLLGTTDTDFVGDADRIDVERSDVDYLLESFNYYFPRANLTDSHIVSTFGGLRPLIFEDGKAASKVSREYQIFEKPENFFSIIGGKLTTYRKMAQKMVDRLARCLAGSFGLTARHPQCVTDRVPLFGGDFQNYEEFRREWTSRLVSEHHFESETAAHFVETYGTRILALLGMIKETPDGVDRIHPDLPYVWGELAYTVDHEMAMTLDDLLVRRTHIFSLAKDQGLNVHEEVADRMGERLGWSADEKRNQIDQYKSNVELTRHFRDRTS